MSSTVPVASTGPDTCTCPWLWSPGDNTKGGADAELPSVEWDSVCPSRASNPDPQTCSCWPASGTDMARRTPSPAPAALIPPRRSMDADKLRRSWHAASWTPMWSLCESIVDTICVRPPAAAIRVLAAALLPTTFWSAMQPHCWTFASALCASIAARTDSIPPAAKISRWRPTSNPDRATHARATRTAQPRSVTSAPMRVPTSASAFKSIVSTAELAMSSQPRRWHSGTPPDAPPPPGLVMDVEKAPRMRPRARAATRRFEARPRRPSPLGSIRLDLGTAVGAKKEKAHEHH